MIKFDFKHILKQFCQTLVDITQLPSKNVFYVGNKDIPDYPYITLEVTQPHVTENSSNSHETEEFHTVINLNCYADDPITATELADTINTRMYDPYFYDPLKDEGIVLAGISLNGASNDNFFGDYSIYAQNLQITLRFNRTYKSDMNRIKNSNLGGALNGKYYANHQR